MGKSDKADIVYQLYKEAEQRIAELQTKLDEKMKEWKETLSAQSSQQYEQIEREIAHEEAMLNTYAHYIVRLLYKEEVL